MRRLPMLLWVALWAIVDTEAAIQGDRWNLYLTVKLLLLHAVLFGDVPDFDELPFSFRVAMTRLNAHSLAQELGVSR